MNLIYYLFVKWKCITFNCSASEQSTPPPLGHVLPTRNPFPNIFYGILVGLPGFARDFNCQLCLCLDGRTFSFFGRRHGRSPNHFSFSGLRTAENVQFSAIGAAERLIMNLWTDLCQR